MANLTASGQAAMDLQTARSKLKQALNKDDGEKRGVSQEDHSSFCDALDTVLERTTSANVQTCKDWIIKHIVPSKTRIDILGDYLVALSKSCTAATSTSPEKHIQQRFHIVLVLNDVLHHVRYHAPQPSDTGMWSTLVHELLTSLASCLLEKDTQLEQRLTALLKFWRANDLLPPTDIHSLLAKIRKELRIAQGLEAPEPKKRVHTLPEWFGDHKAPWFDLPASYMVAPLVEEPRRALEPRDFIPERFAAKSPSKKTKALLDDYFEAIDTLHKPTKDNPSGNKDGYSVFYDITGHVARRDEKDGEMYVPVTAYGWSTEMCDDMEEHDMPQSVVNARDALRSRNRNEPRSRRAGYDSDGSRSPRRRKLSKSQSGSPRNGRSRSRSFSSRDSRSSSRNSYRDPRDRHRSPYDPRREQDLQGNDGSRDMERNTTYPNTAQTSFQYNEPMASSHGPPPAPPFPGPGMPFLGQFPNMPFPPPFPGPMPGMPIPPPPPNFTGPIPGAFSRPPPMPMGQISNNGHPGFPSSDAGYGRSNQGFGGSGFNNRGGYGRGRGRGGGGGGYM